MKIVWGLILGIALSLAAFTANAAGINTEGLSSDQIQQIQQIVNPNKNLTKEDISQTSEKITSYAELGAAIGDSVANAAQKLGVAVNDFSNTWVGKVTIGIIVWKIIGAGIVHAIGCVSIAGVWTFIVVRTWRKYFDKLCIVASVKEKRWLDPTLGEKNNEVVETTTTNYDRGELDGTRFLMLVVLAIAMIPAIALVVVAV